MSIPTLFEGELQYVGFTDSSRAGPCLKFRLHDRDELQKFIGLDARRFAAVFVLLSDDEQPEPPPAAKPEPARGGALARLAGQLSNSADFQRWAGVSDAEEAADFIRKKCAVASRADLDHDAEAAQRFHRDIRLPYAATRKEHA